MTRKQQAEAFLVYLERMKSKHAEYVAAQTPEVKAVLSAMQSNAPTFIPVRQNGKLGYKVVWS